VSTPIKKAFVLGAGLGTRLRPLTDVLPKPLIPVFHRPLVEYTLDNCLAAGIEEFAINTHHLPEKWQEAFPGSSYRGAPLTFFHEPVLLETGGGLKNIESWVGDQPLLVCNGDILTSLNLTTLIKDHTSSGRTATLALRSSGHETHIAVEGNEIVDIRELLGKASGTHQFTGVYCINSAAFQDIPPDQKISIIPSFLELIRKGELGASTHDDGIWLDLGTRESYLDAHQHRELGALCHPGASVSQSAMVEASSIGPGASIGAGATVLASVLWPGSQVEEGAQLTNCIVYSSTPVTGTRHNADL
jgi:mannose-1-phosphate guanylyltransferase